MPVSTLKALRILEDTLTDTHDLDNDEIIDLLGDLVRILIVDTEARDPNGAREDEA